MADHLPYEKIREIITALNTPPLAYDATTRSILFGRIDAGFVGLLPVVPVPRHQLLLDLQQLNRVERLADGSVPFLTWLINAAGLAAGTEQEKVFLRAADEIGHRTSGAPGLDPLTLPEYKETIVHENDMVSHAFMAAGLAAGKGVAKLMVPRFENGAAKRTPDPVIYLGTGWLVADDLLITNHHVINARNAGEPAASVADLALQTMGTTVTFDFDAEDLQGVAVKVQGLEAWESTLDYAVLRLAATGRVPLRLAGVGLTMAEGVYVPVNVIQHPRGLSKKYGIRNNLVSRSTPRDIRYFTDTLEGSSGSPVMDDSWQVVGLHRGSTLAENVKYQGRSTAAINVGTQIHAVLEDLRARYPALAHAVPAF